MAKVIQIRNVPDDVHAELRRRAAESGRSLSDYVLDELERVTTRSANAEVLVRAATRAGGATHRQAVDALRQGPRPPVIVVDASALIEAVVVAHPPADLVVRLTETELHAPHLIDVEVLHVLRRLEATGAISSMRATSARRDFGDLVLTRYPHEPLGDRIWALRRNLSAYDATYVALAEALDAPVVTTDARLGRAPGHRARVETYEGRRRGP